MLVTEPRKQQLLLIDQLLRAQRYDLLEACVGELLAHGLLDDDMFDAARALDVLPTTIYLATLGIENLPAPGARAMWLEVYRTLGRRAGTDGFNAMDDRHPVKWVALAAITDAPPDLAALQRCHGSAADWQAAFELAMDHRCFPLVEQLTTWRLAQPVPVEDWLDIVASLTARHNVLKPMTDLAPLARSFLAIARHLPDIPGLAITRSSLAIQSALYFQKARMHAQAIESLALVQVPMFHRTRLAMLAESSCRLGDIAGSIRWLDMMLEGVGQPWQVQLIANERQTSGILKPNGAEFDPAVAAQALVALQAILAPAGLKVFLVSGTLLGYARGGGLLPHDKDIDVGVLGWESQFDIVLALLKSGQFEVNTSTMEGEKTYLLSVRHRATGIPVDVFIYHAQDGKYVTGVQGDYGYLQTFAFTPFQLEEVDFLGIKIHVPGDIDRNLTENFGNWQTPDPGYISHLESPSTVDVGGLVYQLVGRLKCLEAILYNKRGTLLRALDSMARVQHFPCGMTSESIACLRVLEAPFVDGSGASSPKPAHAEARP